MNALPYTAREDPFLFDLHVRGEIPAVLAGSLVVATSRRIKDRHR